MSKDSTKILLIGNCYYSVFRFRKELIQRLIKEGYDVWTSFPNGEHDEKERGEETAREYGCHFIELSLSRRSMNAFEEIKHILQVNKLIETINPQMVLLFTVKPNLYGGLLACFHRIPYIINVTGLGSAFSKNYIFTQILRKMYLGIINRSYYTFFQNMHDYDYFVTGIKHGNVKVIPGSGVNTEEYCFLPYHDGDNVQFLYMSRVMKEKGIEEFLEAACYFKQSPEIEFVICGDCEETYQKRLIQLEHEGCIRYLGQITDVKSVIKKADCIVHPSYYNEGISNVLLEASSCGRAIITTDNPGCKEVVDNSKNGFVINSRDSQELISAIKQFIALPKEDKIEMGKMGRAFVEKTFDRSRIVNEYLMVMDKATQ